MAIGRNGRNSRNKVIKQNGFIFYHNYDGADEVLDKMLKKITAELLESAREAEKLGRLYDEQTAENEAKIAEHEARAAEHEARAAEHEARATEHEAKAAEYEAKTAENEAKIAQLQKVFATAESLAELSGKGTAFLKTLTPLQIEFKKQVNQRARFTNAIAEKIETCQALLKNGQHDQAERQAAVLEGEFQKLKQHVAAEDKAQEDLVEVLDQYENLVNEVHSTLETISDQPHYYTLLKTKSHELEAAHLQKQNDYLYANRPAKEGSDELGSLCEKAFSAIKLQLQQKKAESSPSNSRASTAQELKNAPRGRSSSEEEDNIGHSSPDIQSSSSDDSDEESKKGEKIRNSPPSDLPLVLAPASSTTLQLNKLLTVENPLPPLPQRQQPPQPELPRSNVSAGKDKEADEESIVSVAGMYKRKPSLIAREGIGQHVPAVNIASAAQR